MAPGDHTAQAHIRTLVWPLLAPVRGNETMPVLGSALKETGSFCFLSLEILTFGGFSAMEEVWLSC